MIEAERLPDGDKPGTYIPPEDGWVCFHCGVRFRDARAARMHFGVTPDHLPRCRRPAVAAPDAPLIEGWPKDDIPAVLVVLDDSGPSGMRIVTDRPATVAFVLPKAGVAVIADESHQCAGGAVARALQALGVQAAIPEATFRSMEDEDGCK